MGFIVAKAAIETGVAANKQIDLSEYKTRLLSKSCPYHDHAQSWDSKSLLLQSSKEDELEKIHTYSRLSTLLYQSARFKKCSKPTAFNDQTKT